MGARTGEKRASIAEAFSGEIDREESSSVEELDNQAAREEIIQMETKTKASAKKGGKLQQRRAREWNEAGAAVSAAEAPGDLGPERRSAKLSEAREEIRDRRYAHAKEMFMRRFNGARIE